MQKFACVCVCDERAKCCVLLCVHVIVRVIVRGIVCVDSGELVSAIVSACA